jgi:hypothetical protein
MAPAQPDTNASDLVKQLEHWRLRRLRSNRLETTPPGAIRRCSSHLGRQRDQIQPMRWAVLTASWRLVAASLVAALER